MDTNSIPSAWLEHDKSIRPYLWSHRALNWTRKILGLVFFILFLSKSLFLQLEWLINGYVGQGFVMWVTFFGVLGFLSEVLSFPFSVGQHWIERHFGLSKQTYLAWLWDHVKGWLVGAVLGLLFLGVLYGAVTVFASHWWWAAWGLMMLLSVLLAQLAPILLIPIFYKLKPMDPCELKERLLKLCERFNVAVKDVYSLGLGAKTEKGNAAFLGIGKTKRIVIGDTLYQKFPHDEVEAVFAHELGHQVHNDLWKGIGVSSVFLFLGFWGANWFCDAKLFPFLETDISRPFGMLWFFIVLSIVQMPFGVLSAMHSRAKERAADSFAADHIGLSVPLGKALERLTFQNRGLFKPNAVIEFLTYSHPAPWRRVTRLGRG